MQKLVYFVLLSLVIIDAAAQSEKKDLKNLVYAEVDNHKLLLDLYMPPNKTNPYLVVWIHGGAWHSGSKESPPLSFTASGFALASIDYRLSVDAKFPAQLHDIKAAIRYLRANASHYGYR